MFPLSHIYVSTKVAEKENDLLVLGSVIPDLAWFSMPLKGMLHNEPNEFWNFVKEKYPDFLDLALGVKLHSQVGKGADFYSDDETIGYAKINGRQLIAEVKKLLEINGERQALVFAHNFIEAALDLHLNNEFTFLPELYIKAFKEENVLPVLRLLGDYLQKDETLVAVEINKFASFFQPESRSSPEKITQNAFIPYAKANMGIVLDFGKALSLINKSFKLTKDSFQSFLDETVKKMKVDFRL